jgi:5'-nucleotidase
VSDERKGNWIQTSSGRPYWPLDPRPEDVCIEDIAHALGMICRYGGHCLDFYSVAEHSVHVSNLVPSQYALAALLHDAPEAYCCDIPRPLKKNLVGYADIEHQNWLAICAAFGLDPALPQCVHEADGAMLFIERDVLLLPAPREDWGQGRVRPAVLPKARIFGHMPGRASRLFLNRFQELYQPEGSLV